MQQGSTAAGKCVCIRNDEVRVLDAGAMYFRRRVVIFFCWPPLMIRSDFFFAGQEVLLHKEDLDRSIHLAVHALVPNAAQT